MLNYLMRLAVVVSSLTSVFGCATLDEMVNGKPEVTVSNSTDVDMEWLESRRCGKAGDWKLETGLLPAWGSSSFTKSEGCYNLRVSIPGLPEELAMAEFAQKAELKNGKKSEIYVPSPAFIHFNNEVRDTYSIYLFKCGEDASTIPFSSTARAYSFEITDIPMWPGCVTVRAISDNEVEFIWEEIEVGDLVFSGGGLTRENVELTIFYSEQGLQSDARSNLH